MRLEIVGSITIDCRKGDIDPIISIETKGQCPKEVKQHI